MGRRRRRYPAAEKLEIIRIVEQSHLPAKRTLEQLGIARRTFYRWYDRYREGGPEALEGYAGQFLPLPNCPDLTERYQQAALVVECIIDTLPPQFHLAGCASVIGYVLAQHLRRCVI